MANSEQANSLRIVKDSLKWFSGQPGAVFKFVVESPDDLDEVTDIVDSVGVPNERVILMPKGTSKTEIESRTPWIVDQCIDRGYRFSSRLHVLIWGDERGK